MLTTANRHLARAVLAVASVLALAGIGMTLLTGQPTMLVGTVLGAAAGGYANQLLRRPVARPDPVTARRVAVVVD